MSSRNYKSADRTSRLRRLPAAAAMALIVPAAAVAIAQSAPQTIPTGGAAPADKVILEHADRLVKNQTTVDEYGEYQVLVGNVRMRKGGMVMTCDSAHFYDTSNSFEAFSNVKMEQGDTLFVYGDQLFYDGPEQLATLYADPGKTVRLINRDVTLRTYVFYYDLQAEVGFYDNWGQLYDRRNTLTSIEGEYHPSTKEAWFYRDVELISPRPQQGDTTTLVTDTLNYNTATGVATIMAPTTIRNTDGLILSSSGDYDTRNGLANLYARSTVRTARGNTLTGDTLFFDRNSGIGEAFGNVVLTDSVRQTSLFGRYGYYNDPTDSAFVTGRALAKEYSRGDTLYLHGDTINAYVEVNGADSVHLTNIFHRVRFYRSDLQGICDSISSADSDSIMRMYRNPVVWSGERQVAGNVIFVHVNDSMPDWAKLPNGGMMSEHIAEDCFNQLAGNKMTVWFNDSTVDRLYVEGNVMMILFPMENDSTYNKYVYLESSTMDAYFDGQSPRKINFWPETTYDIVPLYLAKRRDYRLQDFHDYSSLRPASPDDVFNIPAEMVDLINSAAIDEKSLRIPPKHPDDDEENEVTPAEDIDQSAAAESAAGEETPDQDE